MSSTDAKGSLRDAQASSRDAQASSTDAQASSTDAQASNKAEGNGQTDAIAEQVMARCLRAVKMKRRPKEFTQARDALFALGPSEKAVADSLIAAGLITLKADCPTCSNCWLPTAKANSLAGFRSSP